MGNKRVAATFLATLAIATGVVQHIVSSMEIQTVQTGGTISVAISQVNGAAMWKLVEKADG